MAKRKSSLQPRLESLENRVLLTAGLSFDSATGGLTIEGSDGNDFAVIAISGKNLTATLTSPSGTLQKTVSASKVKSIAFRGLGGDDSYTNNTAKPSVANGGAGNDSLRGGSSIDQLNGGEGNDQLNGGAGNDVLNGGAGNDLIDGSIGNDTECGDEGNDVINGSVGDDLLLAAWATIVSTEESEPIPNLVRMATTTCTAK